MDQMDHKPQYAKKGNEDMKNTSSKIRDVGNGTTRSTDADNERYDLIPPCFIRRVAERFALGAETHGARNWEKGMPDDVIYQHMMYHLNRFREGVPGDDDLAAVGWGVAALMFNQEKRRVK